MGLNNGNTSKKTYLSISNGKITKKVDEQTPGAVKKTKKDGSIYFVQEYDELEGHVVSASVRVTEGFGPMLELVINDVADDYILSMQFESTVSNGFLMRMPNVNFGKPVLFKTYLIEEQGKKAKTYLTLYQDGAKIPNYWSKETPRDLPQMKQLPQVGGGVKWDSTDRSLFLDSYIKNQLQEKIKKESPVINKGETFVQDYPSDWDKNEVNDLPWEKQ